MAEISGLQSILSNMHRQYTAGSMSFEQYATSVSNVNGVGGTLISSRSCSKKDLY